MTDAEEGIYPEAEFETVGTANTGIDSDFPDDDEQSQMASQTRLSQHLERTGSINLYEGESLNYLESLRTPLAADDLIEIIYEAKFFKVTTTALINVIKTHISPDAILSQTEEGGCAELYFDTILTEATALCPTHDIYRPEFVIVKSAMKASYLYELSRTRGPYRERRLQDPNRMEIVTGKLSTAQKPDNTRHGISLPGLRRR